MSVSKDNENRRRVFKCMSRLEKKNGYPPTVREIAADLSISIEVVHHHQLVLEDDGRIERIRVSKGREIKRVKR